MKKLAGCGTLVKRERERGIRTPPSNLSTPFVCAWVTTLGEGLLLGILGGGVPPGSPNPDPISDQKNVI